MDPKDESILTDLYYPSPRHQRKSISQDMQSSCPAGTCVLMRSLPASTGAPAHPIPFWSMHVSRPEALSQSSGTVACCAVAPPSRFLCDIIPQPCQARAGEESKNVYVFPDLSENRHGDAPSITARLGMPPQHMHMLRDAQTWCMVAPWSISGILLAPLPR